jgi:uncharacterized protein (TIGR02444 family)
MSSAAVAPASKGNPLWDFATWAYAEPGVEKACLALQNRFGVDVNMVMFCAWLAYRGSGTSHLAKSLGAALKLSREWQRTLVEPLRSARENLKGVIEASGLMGNDRNTAVALRERIKQCEVDMEQLQTLAFYALVADGAEDQVATRSPAEQKDDALNNLTVYFAATGVKLDPLGQTHVIRILTAIFGS